MQKKNIKNKHQMDQPDLLQRLLAMSLTLLKKIPQTNNDMKKYQKKQLENLF